MINLPQPIKERLDSELQSLEKKPDLIALNKIIEELDNLFSRQEEATRNWLLEEYQNSHASKLSRLEYIIDQMQVKAALASPLGDGPSRDDFKLKVLENRLKMIRGDIPEPKVVGNMDLQLREDQSLQDVQKIPLKRESKPAIKVSEQQLPTEVRESIERQAIALEENPTIEGYKKLIAEMESIKAEHPDALENWFNEKGLIEPSDPWSNYHRVVPYGLGQLAANNEENQEFQQLFQKAQGLKLKQQVRHTPATPEKLPSNVRASIEQQAISLEKNPTMEGYAKLIAELESVASKYPVALKNWFMEDGLIEPSDPWSNYHRVVPYGLGQLASENKNNEAFQLLMQRAQKLEPKNDYNYGVKKGGHGLARHREKGNQAQRNEVVSTTTIASPEVIKKINQSFATKLQEAKNQHNEGLDEGKQWKFESIGNQQETTQIKMSAHTDKGVTSMTVDMSDNFKISINRTDTPAAKEMMQAAVSSYVAAHKEQAPQAPKPQFNIRAKSFESAQALYNSLEGQDVTIQKVIVHDEGGVNEMTLQAFEAKLREKQENVAQLDVDTPKADTKNDNRPKGGN